MESDPASIIPIEGRNFDKKVHAAQEHEEYEVGWLVKVKRKAKIGRVSWVSPFKIKKRYNVSFGLPRDEVVNIKVSRIKGVVVVK